MPELGRMAGDVPSPSRQTISAASYERVAVSDLKKALEPGKPPGPVQAPEPEKAPEHEQAPLEETAKEELPEEVQDVQSIESPGASEAVPPENTTIVVC